MTTTVIQTKGTVIPCCESSQYILETTIQGVKGGMKGWIAKWRPAAQPKLFRKRQKVDDAGDQKNEEPRRMRMKKRVREKVSPVRFLYKIIEILRVRNLRVCTLMKK